MTVPSDIKLIIFDIDGTLADRDTDELLPGVRAWFNAHASEYMIALATNQGGVGLRHWMETNGFGTPTDFPTKEQAYEHICKVMDQLTPKGREDDNLIFYVCFAYQSKKSGKWNPTPEGKENDWEWMPDYRKPAPGLLDLAMRDAYCYPQETLMVGDGEEDEQAANAAHCGFMRADAFFGRE